MGCEQLLWKVEWLDIVLWDACQGKEDAWDGDLDEQCQPPYSPKRVPGLAYPCLKKQILP